VVAVSFDELTLGFNMYIFKINFVNTLCLIVKYMYRNGKN
jgi:hypothetical protein